MNGSCCTAGSTAGHSEGRHLISVDELRAAGALDVPAAWRKSLGGERRHLLPGFEDDEDAESSLSRKSIPKPTSQRTIFRETRVRSVRPPGDQMGRWSIRPNLIPVPFEFSVSALTFS